MARTTAQTLGMLGVLSVPLPATAAVTALALLRGLVSRPTRRTAIRPRTVLVSGGKMTKSLTLARAFHEAGHRVVMVEQAKYRLTGHRFSRAVDAFHVVPEPTAPDYGDALLRIVRAERVDVYVPVCSPVASLCDARVAELLAPYCETVTCDADTLSRLDDKEQFSTLADSLGLAVPDHHRISDPRQVEEFDFASSAAPYVLKSIPYDPVNRLDLTPLPRPTAAQTAQFVRSKPISEATPWTMQQRVTGQEYCTHSTVRNGRMTVFCCCESSASQLNYASVDRPEVEAWVRGFVEPLGLDGQVSLDLIAVDGGEVVAIECNPRTHSAITLFAGHPDLAAAYLDDDGPAITPLPDARPTYWLYQELWRMLRHPRLAPDRMRVVLAGRDAIFAWDDPLPFLLVHHLQIPALLVSNLVHGRPWVKIDVNIGKLVEPAGD